MPRANLVVVGAYGHGANSLALAMGGGAVGYYFGRTSCT